MNKSMIFTVQSPKGNDKPIVYAQSVPTAYKNKQPLAEALIRDWIEDNDVPEATDEEIEDLAHQMRNEGYAWWNEEICFELTEVCAR